uniref:Latent transforming growth factor beta binding protein 1 n=1 Tax=Monopterus albus TaxID=43700 RepID=A0A3Q3KN23_MONAL
MLFGKEVCKGGFCQDTVGSFECYCKAGEDYDPATLECRDIDECLDESVCGGGHCVNTDGSYMCFCAPPLMLDPIRNSPYEAQQRDFQGICWQTITETTMCSEPLGLDRKTTYTECCCLHGKAWGMDCALCPPRDTGTRCTTTHTQYWYGGQAERCHNASEECGILNGCENGRCVRVQEGYTCDCFDGYTLDLSRMACIDVNECSELNSRMSLCKNAKCINTVGSYKCVCLPGFTASDKPNYCVEAATDQTSTHTP